MTKKSEGRARPEAAGRPRGVLVRTASGTRRPFLRGMVTHDLVQRGLSFDDAYAAARAVRDRVAHRGEVSTAELHDLIEQQLAAMLGPEGLARLARLDRSGPRAADLMIISRDEAQPFSRGLLARSVHAAGLDMDAAYRLVTELEGELAREGVTALDSDDLGRRVGDLLERREGPETAARYRLLRRIGRLPRPLVIYLGGASGTGKSTLALELAPLLRIYRINATDTIRQVMRMVFSPAILPALHRSSFSAGDPEGAVPFDEHVGPWPGGREEGLLAAFDEQATRVCVGVRAVVERAVVEGMSIVVEGVHLVPPLVPFPDLEGAAYQLALMLTTLDEESHRARFLSRGRAGGRRGERYLEHFPAIRRIQEHLLAHAELYDIPLLESTDRDTTTPRALHLLTRMLQQRLPRLAEAAAPHVPPPPTLLLFVDGLADHPVRALGERTPLQAARTPVLDRLAREGRCGLADPVAPGVVPDTASGSLAIFGQSPRALKRGPVEALGAGLELAPGDVALRANFATLDERGWVVDRRAGRIREGADELAAALDHLPLPGEEVEVRVKPGTEHRLAVVLRGPGLSAAVAGSDPGDGAPPGPPLVPHPLDPADEAAAHTARLLALFEQEARRALAGHQVNAARRKRGLPTADTVLTRGAGRIHRLEPLAQAGLPISLACVSGDRTVLGLSGWLGAATITGKRMTANLDTDLKEKFAAAAKALGEHDLVVLHLKGADIAAHDRRPDLKVAYLEALDRLLGRLVEKQGGRLRVAVAADHATLSDSGQHGADPVPVLIWGQGVEPDAVESFDEAAVATGALGRFPLQLLTARLFEPG